MRSMALSTLVLATVGCGSIEQPPYSIQGMDGLRADRMADPATDRDPTMAAAAGLATAAAVAPAWLGAATPRIASSGPAAPGTAAPGTAGFAAPGSAAPGSFALAPPKRADDNVGKPYTILRLAAFEPAGDIDSLDTGFEADLSFGSKFLPFLGIEGSVGYFEAGIPGSGDKLWGIPVFANARASLPILILEPYVGGGVGGIYTEFPGDTDWVGAWDAFAGVGVGLGQLSLGVDYRYVRSADTNANFAIEGHTLGAFVSLPF